VEDVWRIFLREVVRLHGVPTDVITDRDSRFTSEVWKSFCGGLGMQHFKSTAFHPESDGQTERMNRILVEYLRRYVGDCPEDWVDLLPLAEFAINSSVQESTIYLPFY